MDKRNVSFDYIRSNEWSLDTNDSYTVLLVVDLMSLQKKDPNNIGDDGHLEYNAYTYDFLSKNYNIELLRALKSTEDNVRLCNFKNSSEYNAIHKIVLNRIPSIFSVHNIIDDTFIEKKMHYIKLLLFANQEYDCSLLLHEVLICMTVFNFVQGTYTFSSENYHQNLSINRYLLQNDIYVSDDGQSYGKNWMLFRLPLYVLYLYVVVKIWFFIGKMIETKPNYRFKYRHTGRFPTFVCNPLLISAYTPITDMLITYISERAWFRKIFIIGSSFFSTYITLGVLSKTFPLLEIKREQFISIFYVVLLFIIFLIECFVKTIDKNVKLLPEPTEAFELSILMTSMPLCLILMFVNMSKLLNIYSIVYYNITRLYKIVILYSTAMAHHKAILVCFLMLVLIRSLVFNYANLSCFIFIVFVCALLDIYWYNCVYWMLRTILWMYFILTIYFIRIYLQNFVNFYNKYVLWMLSIQIWVPLIFLYISYLRDVYVEYNGVFKQYLKFVITLMESNESIDAENIVILSEGTTSSRIPLINGKYQMFPRALLFYHRGVPHITQKFFYEMRNSFSQVLGVSLSLKIVILKELLSLFLRMFPAIITIIVINTSNLALDKFEPVQSFLVGSILFHSYSKLFLQRVAPNVDILTNPYLKLKLQDLIRDHHDVFYVTHSSKQSKKFPVIPKGMKFVITVTGCLMAYIVIVSKIGTDPLQIELKFLEVFKYYLKHVESGVFPSFANTIFVLFLLHFILLQFISQ